MPYLHNDEHRYQVRILESIDSARIDRGKLPLR